MIAKKIPNSKSGSKARRVAGVANYIVEPERENGLEKCIHHEAENFLTDTHEGHVAEMTALAQDAVRSKDPVDHWVLSWRPEERPSVDQVREAVHIFAEHCGLKGHQTIWGLHDDTKNLHVHIAINRVHPDTLKVIEINKGFQKEAAQQAIAIIEKRQGWKSVENARYQTNEKGDLLIDRKTKRPAVKKSKDKPLEPTGTAQDMEIQTSEKSAQRIAIEDGSEIITKATSWADLHEKLAEVGMEYRRNGSGAVIFVGDIGIKASDVNRKFSFGSLQKRFGLYQPANEKEIKNDPHNRTQLISNEYKSDFAKNGFGTGNNMRHLSGCNLAHSEKSRQGKTSYEGVLQLDVGTYRQRDSGMRRGSNSHSAEIGKRRKSIIRPLADNQPGWNEYIAIRDTQKVAKTQEALALQKHHGDERVALAAKLKAERADVLKGSWVGKGDLRNALVSVMAAQHAAQKLALREQHKEQRDALHARYAPLPQYRAWVQQPRLLAPVASMTPNIPQPERLSTKLLALTHSQDKRGLAFLDKGQELFIDQGRNLAIVHHERQTTQQIAAALAVAQHKFGSVLEVTGPDEFKQRAIVAAVEHNLFVRFADPAMESQRTQMIEAKLQAERDAQRAQREQQERAVQEAAKVQAQEQAEQRAAPALPPSNTPGPQTPDARPQTLTTADRADLARAEKQAARVAQREAEDREAEAKATAAAEVLDEAIEAAAALFEKYRDVGHGVAQGEINPNWLNAAVLVEQQSGIAVYRHGGTHFIQPVVVVELEPKNDLGKSGVGR